MPGGWERFRVEKRGDIVFFVAHTGHTLQCADDNVRCENKNRGEWEQWRVHAIGGGKTAQECAEQEGEELDFNSHLPVCTDNAVMLAVSLAYVCSARAVRLHLQCTMSRVAPDFIPSRARLTAMP